MSGADVSRKCLELREMSFPVEEISDWITRFLGVEGLSWSGSFFLSGCAGVAGHLGGSDFGICRIASELSLSFS
jgi:hypothetical protein